jgi:hypothetical protein
MNIESQYQFHGRGRRSNELRSAYRGMMRSLGKCLANNKTEFVVLLNESGVSAKDSDTYTELIDKYVDNICHNQKLMLGTSLLIDMKCKTSNADGIDDDNVKDGYYVMRDYLSFDDDYSYVAVDPVSAVAQGVEELAKFGTKGLEGSQKRKYGALDMAQRREESKNALIQAVVQQKQQQLEAQKQNEQQQQKTKRTVIIVSSIVLGLGILAIAGIAIYRRNKK